MSRAEVFRALGDAGGCHVQYCEGTAVTGHGRTWSGGRDTRCSPSTTATTPYVAHTRAGLIPSGLGSVPPLLGSRDEEGHVVVVLRVAQAVQQQVAGLLQRALGFVQEA